MVSSGRGSTVPASSKLSARSQDEYSLDMENLMSSARRIASSAGKAIRGRPDRPRQTILPIVLAAATARPRPSSLPLASMTTSAPPRGDSPATRSAAAPSGTVSMPRR